MPLLPDLTILTYGEAQAHTQKCSCAVCVVSPQKFSTNNLSVFYIVTYILNHIFEA